VGQPPKLICISDDVVKVQDNPALTNGLNGSRVKRGLFLDKVINKIFNADLNAAVNHIKIGTGKSFEWLKEYLFKLCNPLKFKSDRGFIYSLGR